MAIQIFESRSTDIFTNLALEDFLFKQLQKHDRVLYLWQNSDAVVIGRYQNPYVECNLGAIIQDNIALARRQSGGGTVWHDGGNLCFTFMDNQDALDRRSNIESVATALHGLGIPVTINNRLDILLNNRKISGSAFRVSGGRAFHHGTLLVNSNLTRLSKYLEGDTGLSDLRGIRSVKSRTANLSEFDPSLTLETVAHALGEVYLDGSVQKKIISLDPEDTDLGESINALRNFLLSRAWIFHASPPFSRVVKYGSESYTLRIQGGIISQIDGPDSSAKRKLEKRLIGSDYGEEFANFKQFNEVL